MSVGTALQVWEATPEQINLALREIREELDALQGRRGPTTVHAGVTTDSTTTRQVRVTDSTGALIHSFGPKT